jgi:hypothetical protein
MTNEDIRGGGERMAMATGAAELSIDDVGQTHIRDLHHQSGEETDLGHQSQEETGRDRQSQREKDHGHRPQEEIDPDPPLRGETDRHRLLGDETALTDRRDGDQLRQKSGVEAGQTGNVIMSEHGEETLHLSILDPQHQSHDGDRLIDVLPTLQVEVVTTTETMARMDGAMIIDVMEVATREEMIDGRKDVLRKSLVRVRRQSVNESWQKCNKRPRDWILTERSV